MNIVPPLVSTATETTYEKITNVSWNRLSAFIVDSLIISLIIGGLQPVFGVPQANANAGGQFFVWQNVLNATVHVGDVAIALPGSIVVLVAYSFIQEWLFGATLGKRWNGLVVVTFEGTALTWWRALVRNLIRPIDYGFFCIGYFLVWFDRFHQRVGDRWAGTIVVPRTSLSEPPISQPQTRSRLRGLLLVLCLCVGGCFAFMYYGRPPLVIAGMYNLQQGPFFVAPKPSSNTQNAQLPASCVTGYALGTPTRQGDNITYPITYHIFNGTAPDQAGIIELHWQGFFGGGWQPAFSEGPSSC